MELAMEREYFVKFVLFEPLLGPIHDLDLDGIDWAIVGGGFGTASGAIVCTNRGVASEQLVSDHLRGLVFRQRFHQPDQPDREGFGSAFELIRVHDDSFTLFFLNPQSEVHNPQWLTGLPPGRFLPLPPCPGSCVGRWSRFSSLPLCG